MQSIGINEEESKAFVLSSIALSASLFNVTFWLGVFGTIFFEQLFFIWVAATAALVASLCVPPVNALPAFVSWRERVLLLVPSIWLILEAINNSWAQSGPIGWWYWAAALATAGLTMPYLIYVLVLVAVPDIEQIRSTTLRLALVGIAAMIALAGYLIGQNHHAFLTCDDFKVAGDDIPENCRHATPKHAHAAPSRQ